ncbi:ABC-three component system middle component 6 [Vibrio vulnificus]|uniref:ABC-three component system middle component 6 n=1 Tax=Vibrio vulnificus TaxID=672 RepID=UPI003EDA48CE
MYRLIETSEAIEFSLPVIGAGILSILIENNGRMTIFKLFSKIQKTHPDYGQNRIVQSLLFLYSISAIDFKEPYVEVVNDN